MLRWWWYILPREHGGAVAESAHRVPQPLPELRLGLWVGPVLGWRAQGTPVSGGVHAVVEETPDLQLNM
jgi:hypothetical protein